MGPLAALLATYRGSSGNSATSKGDWYVSVMMMMGKRSSSIYLAQHDCNIKLTQKS